MTFQHCHAGDTWSSQALKRVLDLSLPKQWVADASLSYRKLAPRFAVTWTPVSYTASVMLPR